MAHKNMVGGTNYDTKGGRCRVSGTNYSIKKGRTLVGGTGYDIAFSSGEPIGELSVGTSIYLRESGTPAEYVIVHQGNPDTSFYDTSCTGTWIMRKQIYSIAGINAFPYYSSGIHTYWFQTFKPTFDEATQALMKLVKMPVVGPSSTVLSGAAGFETWQFLPSIYELGLTIGTFNNYYDGRVLDYFKSVSNPNRIAYYNGAAKDYWTRTGYSAGYYYITTSGGSGFTGGGNNKGVNPFMILDPSGLVDPSTFEIIS